MYKIIQDNRVIDIVENHYFVKFLPNGKIAFTDSSCADGIVGSDELTVYSFKARKGFQQATIKEVAKEEASRLKGLLASGETVAADESNIAVARLNTIKKLSNICKSKIIAGFSIKLSDEKEYGFKLTTEDQLNLMSIENEVIAGAETFIYHATDLPCTIFSRDDMLKIISAFKKHTLYHTTYFNAAKQYINTINDTEKILSFTYGTDVSSVVDSPVLRQILKNGGV